MRHISAAPARPEQAYLEHVNISVSDPHRTAAMLEKLTGWTRRWEGPAMNGGRTIHLHAFGKRHASNCLHSSPHLAWLNWLPCTTASLRRPRSCALVQNIHS